MERFCCRVRSNPARLSSFSPDLKSVAHAAIKLRLRPEQSCRLQLLHGPITADTIPSENTAFTTCVDPVSPPVFQPLCCIRCLASACRFRLKWWRRRVPPPGPLCLFHSTFIAIAGFPARYSISVLLLVSKYRFNSYAVSVGYVFQESSFLGLANASLFSLTTCAMLIDHAILTFETASI